MPSWAIQVGAGGAFVLLALFLIGKFFMPKGRSGHCINTVQARDAMDNNKSMKETMSRLETKMDKSVEAQVETTVVLRLIHEESKAQTKVLGEIAKNGKG